MACSLSVWAPTSPLLLSCCCSLPSSYSSVIPLHQVVACMHWPPLLLRRVTTHGGGTVQVFELLAPACAMASRRARSRSPLRLPPASPKLAPPLPDLGQRASGSLPLPIVSAGCCGRPLPCLVAPAAKSLPTLQQAGPAALPRPLPSLLVQCEGRWRSQNAADSAVLPEVLPSAVDSDDDVAGEWLNACLLTPSSGYSLAELRSRTPRAPAMLDGTLCDDVAELFSPPRIIPYCRALGLRGSLSLDLLTGWDLSSRDVQLEAWRVLQARRPKVVITSAPCTLFSVLMASNWSRMSGESKRRKTVLGTMLFDFGMCAVQEQLARGRAFVHEHPKGAASWRRRSAVEISSRPGVLLASFEQCQFGLVSKSGKPMRKPTTIMTNIAPLYSALNGVTCQGGHDHQVVAGWEGGERRSVHSQRYPEGLCRCVAAAIAQACEMLR